MKDVYLQLYSLFGDIDRDYVGALRKTKEAGYAGVEFAQSNYGGMAAGELKAVLKDLDLQPFSTHIRLEELEATLPIAQELELPYLVISGAYCYDLASAQTWPGS